MVQNTVGCSAGMVAHTVLAVVGSLHHYPSSKSHQPLYHCSAGGLHSLGTLMLVCTSYREAAETDAAAMLAKRQIKKVTVKCIFIITNSTLQKDSGQKNTSNMGNVKDKSQDTLGNQ
jgi:hypothetical protein